MKKIVGIVVGVLVAALIIYVIVSKEGVVKKAGLENYIPKDAVAFYSVQDIKGTWDNVKNSNFWKQVSKINVIENLTRQANLTAVTATLAQNLGFEPNEKNIMALLGNEVAIAIVVGARNDPEPKVLVLSQGTEKKGVANTVGKLIGNAKKTAGTTVASMKHQNVELLTLTSADPTVPEVNYAQLGDVMVMGIGNTKTAVQNVIGLYKGKSRDTIARTEGFKKLNALAAGTGKNVVGKFYMDFEKISQTVGGLNLPIPGGGAPANLGAPLSILKSIGGVTWIDKGLQTKILVIPNKANMDAATKMLWDVKPKKAVSLELVPEGTILYSVSNSLDVASLWKMWKDNLSKQAPEQAKVITDAVLQAETSMGMSIEGDILSWIGDEISYTFNEINVEGVFPIPKMSLIIKVTDEAKARAFLQRIVELVNEQAITPPAAPAAGTTTPAPAFQLNLEKSSYSGVEIESINIPLVGKGLSPGFAFVKGFLVISTSTATIEKMIDVSKKKGASLVEDANFKKIGHGLSRKVNQLGYINTAKIFDSAIDICNWIVSFQQLNIPGAAMPPAQIEATRKTLTDTVIPLLRCLKVVDVIGVSTVYTKEGIEQTIVTKIEDL
ncbi:DUF3352 domain-containing protein [Candidatus Auribacterota bacterium]